MNTGGLALCLGEKLGVTTVTVRRTVDGLADPNWVDDHPLKRELETRGIVRPGRTVVDLHGMSDSSGFGVAVGGGPGLNGSNGLVESVADELVAWGIAVDQFGVQTGLAARRHTTMTAWAQMLGARAVQIEIARTYRSLLSASEKRQAILAALVAVLSRSVERA